MTSLDQRILAINYLNEKSAEKLKSIKDELLGLVGKKITLSDGSKSKKFTLDRGEQKDTTILNGTKVFLSAQFYYLLRGSHLKLEVKVCIYGGSYDDSTYFCQYQNGSHWLGNIVDQVLVNANDYESSLGSVEYNVQNPLSKPEFLELSDQYAKALQAFEDLKSKVPFQLRDFLPK